MAEAVQYFVDEAGKKDIDIGFDLAPAQVAGDSFLLRDLVDNLVDNAVRYTPRGRHGHGALPARGRGRRAAARSRIPGPASRPASARQVFQRFVRLDDKIAGSGLGLAIVRDIAQAHGARVELGDGPGAAGLRVAVRFPAP